MQRLITKEKFKKIFEDKKYRYKFDKVLLNFFGLDNNIPINKMDLNKSSSIIEFHFFINTELILKIHLEDTKKLFVENKKFYINFSYREVDSFFEILIPCYYEFYIPYCYRHIKVSPKLYLMASLLYCTTLQEVETVLKLLKIFSSEEIKNILKIIKDK